MTRVPRRFRRARLLLLSLAAGALAGTSALAPAQAREAPCGNYRGNKCTELLWCLGYKGNKYCETITLSYYRAEGEPIGFE